LPSLRSSPRHCASREGWDTLRVVVSSASRVASCWAAPEFFANCRRQASTSAAGEIKGIHKAHAETKSRPLAR